MNSSVNTWRTKYLFNGYFLSSFVLCFIKLTRPYLHDHFLHRMKNVDVEILQMQLEVGFE